MATKHTPPPVWLYYDPRLIKRSSVDPRDITIRLRFVCLINGQVRNCTAERREFDDLCVEGYVHLGDNGEYELRGVNTHYFQPTIVGLDRAERMVKLLRKLNRGLQRQHMTTSKLFSVYAKTVAAILGAKGIVTRDDDYPTSNYDEMKHMMATRRTMITVLHGLIYDHLAKLPR